MISVLFFTVVLNVILFIDTWSVDMLSVVMLTVFALLHNETAAKIASVNAPLTM